MGHLYGSLFKTFLSPSPPSARCLASPDNATLASYALGVASVEGERLLQDPEAAADPPRVIRSAANSASYSAQARLRWVLFHLGPPFGGEPQEMPGFLPNLRREPDLSDPQAA